MKRFLFISSLLLYLLTFTQCKPNSSKDNTLAVKKLMNNENKKKHEIDSLKYLGVEKNKLMKHLKLQELAWFGGDFRDDQSQPRYMPTQEDFLLTIPLVEHYLYTHGFKKPSKELFEKRIKQVFGKDLGANTKSTFINLSKPRQIGFFGTITGSNLFIDRINLFTWSEEEMYLIAQEAINAGYKTLGGIDYKSTDGNFILEPKIKPMDYGEREVIVTFTHQSNLYAGLYHIQMDIK